MNATDILDGLVAGGVGGIASGLLGITSGGILGPLLVLILGNDQHVVPRTRGDDGFIKPRAEPHQSG
jgi:uncharacterized membrane protein YfcA